VSPGNGRFAHHSAATAETVVMDAKAIRRALLRIAHEVLEHHSRVEDLVLVGMRTRGVPLAERIAASIEKFEGKRLEIGALDIALHRDDLSLRAAPPVVRPSSLPESIDDRVVILLDDVLFTGRSIRAALDALTDYGRPSVIELAVLVDRGHRELPIRPDYVGKNIPTHRDDVVEVHLSEVDDGDSVIVRGAAIGPNEEAGQLPHKPEGEATSEQEA
jgi:pyrimidine operon attenuation protein/uracil phosphoribosyltransferase